MIYMIATGISLIGTLTAAFYNFCKIDFNKAEKEDNTVSDESETLIPVRPPGRSQNIENLNEIQEPAMIRERCSTCDSTISNHPVTRLIKVQIENNPSKISTNDPEHVSDNTTRESMTKISEQISSITIQNNNNKRILRKTYVHNNELDNVTNKKFENQMDKYYLSIPNQRFSSRCKNHSISTSTKINHSQESNESFESTIFNALIHLINEDNNNTQNDVTRIITIKLKNNSIINDSKNNDENRSSSMLSDSFKTKNGTTMNSKNIEFIIKKEKQKKISKLFQCHK